MRARLAVLIGFSLVVAGAAAALSCGVAATALGASGSAIGNEGPPPPHCPVGSTEVTIGDNFFNPSTVNVPLGGIVCWRNIGEVVHTATSDTGVFDSGPLQPGGLAYWFPFNSGGTYPYHCDFHLPTMTGTVSRALMVRME